MIGEIYSSKKQAVGYLFVNCENCGEPLITEESRLDGYCDRCLCLPEEQEIEYGYDPYGQPIFDEEPA
jgi:hypothetical protein